MIPSLEHRTRDFYTIFVLNQSCTFVDRLACPFLEQLWIEQLLANDFQPRTALLLLPLAAINEVLQVATLFVMLMEAFDYRPHAAFRYIEDLCDEAESVLDLVETIETAMVQSHDCTTHIIRYRTLHKQLLWQLRVSDLAFASHAHVRTPRSSLPTTTLLELLFEEGKQISRRDGLINWR